MIRKKDTGNSLGQMDVNTKYHYCNFRDNGWMASNMELDFIVVITNPKKRGSGKMEKELSGIHDSLF